MTTCSADVSQNLQAQPDNDAPSLLQACTAFDEGFPTPPQLGLGEGLRGQTLPANGADRDPLNAAISRLHFHRRSRTARRRWRRRSRTAAAADDGAAVQHAVHRGRLVIRVFE
eukprot:UN3668